MTEPAVAVEIPSAPRRRTPVLVWLVILALASIQPALIYWIQHAPPAGTVATGLAIPDSALFLQSMRIPENGLDTPYSTCNDGGVHAGPQFYAVPHLWLYAGLGYLARMLGLSDLVVYGAACGLGMLLYLWAVYRLLAALTPRHATCAFALFALSAGPGGLLYVASSAAGWIDRIEFESLFFRFAVYDLMEGPHFNPALYAPRLYYTLPLAVFFAAWVTLVRAGARGQAWPMLLWMPVLAAAAWVNARFGTFALGVVWLFLWLKEDLPATLRLRLLSRYAVPVLAGVTSSAWFMAHNPAAVENHLHVANMAMWFSPFLCAAGLHIMIASRSISRGLAGLPPAARVLSGAVTGYLVAYGILYLVHSKFQGTLLTGRDGAVAKTVSDWALAGMFPGVLAALIPSRDARGGGGFALWFLLFTAVALSGFGGGWFLRFGPQRLQVFIWLPLCVLAAARIAEMRRPAAAFIMVVLLGMGITSIAVSALYFQGPLGREGARGLYPRQHAEIMSTADARLMEHVRSQAMVLTTAPAADILVLRNNCRTVFGIGSFNLTDCSYLFLSKEIERFFDFETDDAEREDIARRLGAAYVYCPDTWPVAIETIDALRNALWLDEVAADGRGALFFVTPEGWDNAETRLAATLPRETR